MLTTDQARELALALPEAADAELLEDLLDYAWRAKAPARLLREARLGSASNPGPTAPRARR